MCFFAVFFVLLSCLADISPRTLNWGNAGRTKSVWECHPSTRAVVYSKT